mmetsp:Transcript_13753/g.20733  ORF Transcript_13753/g.20733 Transcript_13753/m.20733 type:complete len:128 (+) Transcript_13753:73-456(+)
MDVDFSVKSVHELVVTYEIGLGRSYETEIFASDCSSPITGIAPIPTDERTPMGQHFELLRLDYDIDSSSIMGINIWNADVGQLEFPQVVRLVHTGENGSSSALVITEDRRVLTINVNLGRNGVDKNT